MTTSVITNHYVFDVEDFVLRGQGLVFESKQTDITFKNGQNF